MTPPLGHLTQSHRRILDTLLGTGASSRAEIAALTGLTRPAISQFAQELIDTGWIAEEPARQGQRGQPARPLAICADAAFSAGVNFSHSYLELMLLDLAGRRIDSARTTIAKPGPEEIGQSSRALLTGLMSQHRLSPDRLLGVGFSLPGDFYSDGSLMPHPWFPELRRPDFSASLTGALGFPVVLDNDGRASAIGERVIGRGRQYRTFMLVHLGHGVGGGLIIDGKPYRGAQGNAGILGQYFPYGAPRPSGQDLLEALQQAGFAMDDFDGLEALPVKAAPVLETWIKRAADQLAGVLAMTGRFFGPEAIIIAGRLPPAITNALAAAINLRQALPPQDDLPLPYLSASTLGSAAGMAGAAALPIFQSLLPNTP